LFAVRQFDEVSGGKHFVDPVDLQSWKELQDLVTGDFISDDVIRELQQKYFSVSNQLSFELFKQFMLELNMKLVQDWEENPDKTISLDFFDGPSNGDDRDDDLNRLLNKARKGFQSD
jgi:hypothetical protein